MNEPKLTQADVIRMETEANKRGLAAGVRIALEDVDRIADKITAAVQELRDLKVEAEVLIVNEAPPPAGDYFLRPGWRDDGVTHMTTPTTHELKSWPECFEALNSGTRTFDLRKNDRNYQVGDILVLKEFEPDNSTFSGRWCRRKIVHMLKGAGDGCIESLKGLAVNYVILGLEPTDGIR